MMNIKAQIQEVLSELDIQLRDDDLRAKREAAQACLAALEALQECACSDERAILLEACERVRCTYDALHQELQYQLEWASSQSDA